MSEPDDGHGAREAVSFRVEGEPRPQPRPRFDPRSGRTFGGAEHRSTRSVIGWKHAVALRGIEAMRRKGLAPFEGPIWLEITFRLLRPKSHHVAGDRGRPLRPSAPLWHRTKPDRDNLVKAVLDALNGVTWVDDSQVAAGPVRKTYADSPEEVGAWLTIAELPERPESQSKAGVKPRERSRA